MIRHTASARWIRTALLLLLPLAAGAEPPAADWPQYRGPHRDGIAPAAPMLAAWPDDGPPRLWSHEIGAGFSGISVSGDNLLTMFAVDADSNEVLVCYDRMTGMERWRHVVGDLFVEEFGNGPRSTPTIADGRVFALGATGTLHAVSLGEGTPLWSVAFPERFGATTPIRGFAVSPLVDGDLVIMEVGGEVKRDPDPANRVMQTRLVAFDAASGEVRWEYLLDPGSLGYCSPLIRDTPHGREYLFTTSRHILALDREGALLWRHETLPGIIAMPVLADGGRIFLSSSGDFGCVMLETVREGDSTVVRELWTSRRMKNTFNSSLIVDGYLYGFNNATLTCMDVATGELAWRKRGLGKGGLIAADGHLVIIGDKGTAVLAAASPEAYVEQGRFQALTGKCWTIPTLVDGMLYCRSQNELVAYDLRTERR